MLKDQFTFDESIIRQAVKESPTIKDTLLYLGLELDVNNYKKLKSRCTRYKIDTSHFTRAKSPPAVTARHKLSDVCVENSTYTNISSLKRRLVNSGTLPYECSDCGNPGEWNGRPITLQLDHKNGVKNDQRIDNLRFLCPNCHSQTTTFGGRNSIRKI